MSTLRLAEHRAGDMLNLTAAEDGTATVDALVPDVTLGDGSPTDVLGRSLIVHARPDDYATQPAGNSGDRIACGLIVSG